MPPDHAGPSLKNTFRHDQNRPYSSGLPSLKMHQASQTLGSKRPRRTHSRRMEAFPGPHRHPGSCVSLAFWRPSRHHCLPLSFNHSIPISFWKLGCSLSRPSFKTPCPPQSKRWAPEPSPLHRLSWTLGCEQRQQSTKRLAPLSPCRHWEGPSITICQEARHPALWSFCPLSPTFSLILPLFFHSVLSPTPRKLCLIHAPKPRVMS